MTELRRRFDHFLIAVGDLQAGLNLYRDVLGFDARLGGRHVGRGTENALIRFGEDYIELIAPFDEAEANTAGRGSLVEFIRQRGGGLVAYCLSTSDLDAEAAQQDEAGLSGVGPFPMRRVRPDGIEITWRLLWPGGDAYRRPWPFYIQWDQPPAERLAQDPPGEHPIGARAVAEVDVLAANLERGIDLYRRQLDLPFVGRDSRPELAAQRASFELDGCRIVLLAPSGPGEIATALAELGEGIYQAVLRVASLEQARAWLARNGVSLSPVAGCDGDFVIDPARAAGARLVLRET
jgi:catechol 2,3-dioxygenase-like lactoylglutathione lyase family enzyme